MSAEGEGGARRAGVMRSLAALALVGAEGAIRLVNEVEDQEKDEVLLAGMKALAAAGACAKGALMAAGMVPLDAGVWN